MAYCRTLLGLQTPAACCVGSCFCLWLGKIIPGAEAWSGVCPAPMACSWSCPRHHPPPALPGAYSKPWELLRARQPLAWDLWMSRGCCRVGRDRLVLVRVLEYGQEKTSPDLGVGFSGSHQGTVKGTDDEDGVQPQWHSLAGDRGRRSSLPGCSSPVGAWASATRNLLHGRNYPEGPFWRTEFIVTEASLQRTHSAGWVPGGRCSSEPPWEGHRRWAKQVLASWEGKR